MKGGAVGAIRSDAVFNNTRFIKNYARSGGVLSVEALSTASFENVIASQNVGLDQAGVVFMSGTSKMNIISSNFTENRSYKQAAVLYFLGTGSNQIRNSIFSHNYAYFGYSIMFSFADTVIDKLTMKDNNAPIASTGIFATFSLISISNSNFITEEIPFGYKDYVEAFANTDILGLFLQR